MLKDLPTHADLPLPRLSVIIPARNEEKGIGNCIESLMAQDYPELEVVVVDDRSTDGTGQIADQYAAASGGRVVVEHIRELPDGWLGKCNALARGAKQATGEYILFSDGDVVFGESALKRAMIHTISEGADMMVVIPHTITHSVAEHAIMLAFVQTFAGAIQPWRALNRRSSRFVGVGAFNLVGAEMYKKIGGHRFLRLQVVDDVGLGKLIKHAGGVVRIAYGIDQVSVRWQESLRGHIHGLEKNAFAAMRYNPAYAVIAVLGLLFLNWWPWLGVFFGPLPARILCGLCALVFQPAVGFGASRFSRMNPMNGYLMPFGATFFAWAILRSAVLTIKRGGIQWRDTFYPLSELRKFRL